MTNTVSLEVAKKLKEAGWKVPPTFLWKNEHNNNHGYEDRWEVVHASHFVAPTIAELLEALPDRVQLIRNDHNGTDNHWFACVDDDEPIEKAEDPADALGLLWLALKEKNLV